MKKLLIASTALSLAGGAAFAEMAITVSGDAELGVDYASEPVADATTGAVGSKHSFVHEVGIDFTASGTTDGGLTFGGEAGFDTGDDVVNTGTVHVSGSFGKLTIGDNDAADLNAGGIADIGMNGIGVDDMVEGLRGTTAAQLRYDNDFGQIKIAISAGTKDGSAAVAAVPASEWRITDHMTSEKMTTHVFRPYYSLNEKGVLTSASTSEITRGTIMVTGAPITVVGATVDGVPVFGTATVAPDMTAAKGNPIDLVSPPGSFASDNFDELFGVIYRGEVSADGSAGVASVVIDLDRDFTTTPDRVEIYGYSRSNDGATILDADGKPVLATSDAGKAFTMYEKHYNLGADKKVGGKDTGTPANVVMNSDTVKVASNAVAAVPAVASDSEFAFGMSFNAGGVTIGVGYDSNKTVSMGAGFTTGEITTNLLYVKTEDDNATPADEEMTGMGVDMAYTMGASKVTLAYGRRKPEMGEAMDAVGMGVTHDLGGGATLNAGFGKVDKDIGTAASPMIVAENKASIGLMFEF